MPPRRTASRTARTGRPTTIDALIPLLARAPSITPSGIDMPAMMAGYVPGFIAGHLQTAMAAIQHDNSERAIPAQLDFLLTRGASADYNRLIRAHTQAAERMRFR
jgi:hypothetical protein